MYICVEPPTRNLREEAASAGLYESPVWNKTYPKIQILTIEELLAGAQVKMPPSASTFKQAERAAGKPGASQPTLGLE